MPTTIVVHVENRVATIALSRPEVRNAINREMVDELHAALSDLEARDDVHALVFRGADGRSFASGADIAELRDRRRVDALRSINGALLSRVERFPRPTVAAIQGHALGAGCELALACDFRVAGESARLGQPEVTLGIMAAAGGTRRLPALVGLSQARRLLFSGAVIPAKEALAIGLVDLVVPDDFVLAAVDGLLAPILAASPEAVRATKRALLLWSHGASEEDLANFDARAQSELFESEDKLARMDAFLAKRSTKR